MPDPQLPEPQLPEPWLRGTFTDLDPLRRQVLHSLELVGEEASRFCAQLSDEHINARPGGIATVAFHLRHLARSLDRLLTYAEGGQLSPAQHAALASEHEPAALTSATLEELRTALMLAAERVLSFDPAAFSEPRFVGRQRLPTTLASLLIHCAEHSQRHIGQAITTSHYVRQVCTTNSAPKTEVRT